MRFNTIITTYAYVLCLCCIYNAYAQYSFVLNADQFQMTPDNGYTLRTDPFIRETTGYWIKTILSIYSTGSNDDRRYAFYYGRPVDDNLDWSEWTSLSTYTGPQTDLRYSFTRDCWTPPGTNRHFLFSISSTYDGSVEDRQFTFTCKELPPPYSYGSCYWTPYEPTDWKENGRVECTNGLIRAITSIRDSGKEDRKFMLRCCTIVNTPMRVIPTSAYQADTLLTSFKSDWDPINKERSIQMSSFASPWWLYGIGGVTSAEYTLTTAIRDVWTRICPKNGALKTFATYGSNIDWFVSTCVLLADAFTTADCEWTEYMNDFYGSFDAKCPYDGPIRGIHSYKSAVSDDRRFKLYCCVLKRQAYVKDTSIQLAVKTAGVATGLTGTRTLDLCWNNDLYQGVVHPRAANTWYTADDVVKHGSCGNVRLFSISTACNAVQRFSSVRTTDGAADYTIEGFNFHQQSGTTSESDICVQEGGTGVCGDDMMLVEYPDDYLTKCSGTATCTGDMYNADGYMQYLMTVVLCPAFTMTGTAQIAVILRGLEGNLDRKTINGGASEEVIGIGNIGDIVHLSIEYEGSPGAMCIQNVIVHDPFAKDNTITFGSEHFGDGVILADNCKTDGDFMRLTGIQFVPCFDVPFDVTPHATSVYTSIQIHACSGVGAGIEAVNSDLLSLTITGLSKSGRYIHKGPYSLTTSEDWTQDDSRDYTMQVSGGVESLSLVSITNNHQSDVLCVDSVLINGVEAFLTHYWVGYTDDRNSLATIPAVLSWPICDVEYTTTVEAESKLIVAPDSVATSVCVNKNRLVSVECAISQTYETYEEATWEHQYGDESSTETTIEKGKEFSKSKEHGWDVSVGSEQETNYAGVGITVSQSAGVHGSYGSGRTWSTSEATTTGTNTINMETDGKVEGKTNSVECSGSVSVPPSQQIQYSILIDNSAAEIKTFTDMKMTKCSAFLYGEDYHDPNDYIYIYGIEGKLMVKDAVNCHISFSQATKVSPESITCGEERVLATREWGTFVPQCEETDPNKYMKCQCSYGDRPTCGCVDPTSGNLVDTAKSSVVLESDEYKWTHWCNDNCGNDSYNAVGAFSSAYVSSGPNDHESHSYKPVEVAPVTTDYYALIRFGVISAVVAAMLVVVAAVSAVVIYMVNSYKYSAINGYKYSAINQFDGEVNVEIDK
eukprot:6079_1